MHAEAAELFMEKLEAFLGRVTCRNP